MQSLFKTKIVNKMIMDTNGLWEHFADTWNKWELI